MRALAIGAATIAALAVGGIAGAESITITGRFPAPYREAGYLRRVSIDRVTGGDGRALAFALERALSAAGRSVVLGGAPAAGGISGDVATGIDEHRVDQEREFCAEKGQNGDCTRREKRRVACTSRTIDLNADVRLVAARDGRIVYSARKTRREEVSWCPGDSVPQPVESRIRALIDSIAGEVASDITPYERTYSQRFYESRDGLPKPLGDRFKAAIAQTKHDMPGACAALTALDGEVAQFAIAYDAGLCAEARGDYAAALALYRRAGGLRPRDASDFNAGIDRATRLIQRAEDDAAGR